MSIEGKNWDGKICILRYNSGSLAEVGDVITTFRGEQVELRGGTPPHNDRSAGRVIVRSTGKGVNSEFYPNVVNAHWEVKE